ncbi:MAG: hypothetical protein VB071_14685 [Lawsonibacter sp.]|nr:hypothetical protein [Lawsonibacter sp.]
MAILDRELGQLTGDVSTDLARIANYLAYLREQVEFNDANVKRRLAALEKGE